MPHSKNFIAPTTVGSHLSLLVRIVILITISGCGQKRISQIENTQTSEASPAHAREGHEQGYQEPNAADYKIIRDRCGETAKALEDQDSHGSLIYALCENTGSLMMILRDEYHTAVIHDDDEWWELGDWGELPHWSVWAIKDINQDGRWDVEIQPPNGSGRPWSRILVSTPSGWEFISQTFSFFNFDYQTGRIRTWMKGGWYFGFEEMYEIEPHSNRVILKRQLSQSVEHTSGNSVDYKLLVAKDEPFPWKPGARPQSPPQGDFICQGITDYECHSWNGEDFSIDY